MAPGTPRSTSAWTEEAVIALLLNIMRQTNPTLSATGWKDITEKMARYGFNQNVLKKKWLAIRSQFAAKNNLEQNDTSADVPASNPKRKHDKGANAKNGTPTKKARTKATSNTPISTGILVNEPADDNEADNI